MDIFINESKEIETPVNLVYLWGMMGIGKTKIARQLAAKIGWQFVDTDEAIERVTGKDVSQIFRDDGEDAFRELERKIIEQLVNNEKTIVATGGGLPCFLDNAELMNRTGLTIWLDGNEKFLASRLYGAKQSRPLISNVKSKEELIDMLTWIYKNREKFYNQANWKIKALELDLDKLAKKLKSSGA